MTYIVSGGALNSTHSLTHLSRWITELNRFTNPHAPSFSVVMTVAYIWLSWQAVIERKWHRVTEMNGKMTETRSRADLSFILSACMSFFSEYDVHVSILPLDWLPTDLGYNLPACSRRCIIVSSLVPSLLIPFPLITAIQRRWRHFWRNCGDVSGDVTRCRSRHSLRHETRVSTSQFTQEAQLIDVRPMCEIEERENFCCNVFDNINGAL